jgi:hypothetical protein
MRKLTVALAIAASAFLGLAALAQQPGTSGTEKRFQEQGLRFGVLTGKNNTATALAGAATCNGCGTGVVTSEALTTVAGSPYTLTLTNNLIAATDLVFATVALGTATTGEPDVQRITPGSGSVVIVVKNTSTFAAFNGTLKIGFMVVKQSALGAD